MFYFFLPKKLNLFSRSLSLPSLLRMVTPPVSPDPGEMGGMVMARLRARGPPGESPAPVGMEPRMERIQELISAFRQKKKVFDYSSFRQSQRHQNQTILHKQNLCLIFSKVILLHISYLILCLEQVFFSIS